MKIDSSDQRNQAMTFVEVLVVIFVLVVLAALLLPALAASKKKSSKINCVNNLKQISLACRIWSGDNGDKYPTEVSVATGGTMELMNTSDAWKAFQVMSNELSTPKVLVCPSDLANDVRATNFSDGLKGKISYFIGADSTETNAQAFLSGDDNFAIGGESVKSGLLTLTSNSPVTWTAARHHFAGNVGLTDGSVQPLSNSGLKNQLQQTGLATNRLAIP